MEDRACTCHPDEAPVPCQRKYALNHCRDAKSFEDILRGMDRDGRRVMFTTNVDRDIAAEAVRRALLRENI